VPGPDSAEDIVEREVRELVRRRRLDPGDGDTTEVMRLIEEVVSDYEERSLTASLPRLDRSAAVKAVADRLIGLGPLQPYFDDPDVEEIWINESGKVFIAKAGRPLLTTTVLTERRSTTWWSACSARAGAGSTCPAPSWTPPSPTAPGCTW
jgi:pilus assembly protein CpaF